MLTNYEAKRINDLRFGNGSYTPASELWLALLLADPTRSGSLSSEVSDSSTGYERVEVTGLITATDATARTSYVNAVVAFPTALLAWGDIGYAALMDAEAVGTGNMLEYTELEEVVGVPAGFPLTFAPGQVVFRIG